MEKLDFLRLKFLRNSYSPVALKLGNPVFKVSAFFTPANLNVLCVLKTQVKIVKIISKLLRHTGEYKCYRKRFTKTDLGG